LDLHAGPVRKGIEMGGTWKTQDWREVCHFQVPIAGEREEPAALSYFDDVVIFRPYIFFLIFFFKDRVVMKGLLISFK
jgi:hypothetical protein